jgi:hypothetical protein
MESLKLCFRSLVFLLLSVAACVSASSVMAADSNKATAINATIQKEEHEDCLNGNTGEDRATCLREAGAAKQERQRGNLRDNGDYGANASKRCATLPEAERNDCERRMRGHGSASGSVDSGGIVRELVTPVPASQSESK